MSRFVIDSRDALNDDQHDFDSANNSADFVIQLPKTITRMNLTQAEIPLTYYIFNEYTNKIVFRVPDGTPQADGGRYWLAEIEVGTWDTNTFPQKLVEAISNASPLNPNGVPGAGTLVDSVTYNDITKKLRLEMLHINIQFITSSDPNASGGIPFGDPDGFPSELTGTTPDPIRQALPITAGYIGLTPNSVVPDPNDPQYLGLQYAFGPGSDVAYFPNIINLSGELYMYLKSDLAGLSQTRQGQAEVTFDINEDDISVIQSAIKDRGIVEKIQITQSPFTIEDITINNAIQINFSEPTDIINFRLSFRNNIPIDLNGVTTSYTIDT